jgi:trehalose/maltose transport system permease protein
VRRANDAAASVTTGAPGLEAYRVRWAWAFAAPAVLALLLTAGWPLARTLWLGFTDADLTSLGGYRFIGLENFLTRYGERWSGLLIDAQWWRAVWNTLLFTAVSVALEAVLGVTVALVLNRRFPGRAWVRAAVLVPWAIPTIVSARLWGWMLNDQFGVVNAALLKLGILSQPLAWTADPDLAMAAVILVDVWKTTPFVALLMLAALQTVPEECYEAARIDGAGPVRTFFHITLPLIRPALVVAVVFRMLDALRVFDLIYVLTANSPATMSMSSYARQQLVDFQDVGYGSAASTLVFLVVGLTIVLYLRVTRSRANWSGAAT